MTRGYARERQALPIGLAQGASVVRPVRKGALVTYADVELPAGSDIARVRRLQDEMTAA
jgi:predicted homoserine dehydrogenase-like protein